MTSHPSATFVLSGFVRAFRTPDLRKKLLFTGAMIVLDKMGLGQDLQLSGVSLLIMVGVGLDTVKQVQSQLEQHSYQGFLR